MKSSRSFGGRARKWFKFTGKRLPTTTKESEQNLPSTGPAKILKSCEKDKCILQMENEDGSHFRSFEDYTLSPSTSACGSTVVEAADLKTNDNMLCTETEKDSFTIENGAFTSGSESASSEGEEETEELNESFSEVNVFEANQQPLSVEDGILENARLKSRKRTFGQRKARGIITLLNFDEDMVSKKPRVSDYFEQASEKAPATKNTAVSQEPQTTSNETTEELKESTMSENDAKDVIYAPEKRSQSPTDASDLDFNEYDRVKIEQPTSRTSLELARLFFEKLDQEQLAVSTKGDITPPPLSRPIVRSRRTLDLETNPEVARLYQTHVSVCRGAGVKPLSVKAFWEQRKKHHQKPSDRVYNGFFDED